MTMAPVVILTALNLEYTAIREHLTKVETQRHEAGTRFEVGTLPGTDCEIAVGLTGKGNQASAVLAERAIAEFEPVAVLFSGIAGGLWETTKVGDVVVATHVHAYHGGTSEDDGLKARPRTWEAPHHLHQLALHLGRNDDWKRRLACDARSPVVHFGAVAAGEVVVNSRISQEARWIRTHYDDAMAIEMEAAGVAQAGHLNNVPIGIVRGISDMADGTKTSNNDRDRQPHAAANAAAFALALAQHLIVEQEHAPMRKPVGRAAADASTVNIASGPVGIQAGVVTGSTVSMHTTTTNNPGPQDLVAALTEIREDLSREHAVGVVDDDTYEAAQQELDTASTSLETPTPEGKKATVLALKRLRGLIADVGDVAVKIAALIAAVHGWAT